MKHIPRKRFGQNFLVDAQVVAGIVTAIAPARSDLLVEIGPGLGALTDPLLDCVDHLHVVEIDRDIIARLHRRYPSSRLTVHAGDALAFDFAALGRDLRIVGNLPYNISTPLLFHLADAAAQVRDMHFMLQKEVVERMVAEAGEEARGRLSVMLQYRFWLEWLIDVPPTAFDPPPKVDSAVVRMIPRAVGELAADDAAGLQRVVAASFAQRRKMLRNNLKGLLDDAGFGELGIAPTLRAEDLAVADYVRIANYLQEKRRATPPASPEAL